MQASALPSAQASSMGHRPILQETRGVEPHPTTIKRESDKSINTICWLLLLGLIGKCLYETLSGSMLWSGLHFGSIGVPNPLAHGGGVLGGVLSYLVLNQKPKSTMTRFLNFRTC